MMPYLSYLEFSMIQKIENRRILLVFFLKMITKLIICQILKSEKFVLE